MTNQPTIQPNTGGQVVPPPAPKESIVSKIIGGFMWWIGSLTGKPPVRKQPQQMQTQVPGVSAAKTTTDDSVAQDLAALKNLVGKVKQNVTEKVSTNVAPAVSRSVASGEVAAGQFVKKRGGIIKKILPFVVILFVILLLLMVVAKIFKKSKTDGEKTKESPTPSVGPATPTQFVFEPPTKSVYAEDPEVLKLEQDINVLVREIGGTNIKETLLNPPTLDYNVSF